MLGMAAFDFFSKQCNALDNFIHPLKIYGIDYFSFARIYNTGKVIFFCNHLDWLTFKTDKHLYDFDGFIPEDVADEIVKNYNFHVYTGNGYKENRVLNLLFETNRWNSLDLYKRNKQYIDIMHVASTRDNVGIINFYINNNKLLQNYFDNFLNQFEETINTAFHSKYYVEFVVNNPSKKEIKFSPHLFLPNSKLVQKDKFKLLSVCEKITLNVNNEKINLSQRESSCMYLLTKGKSCKEIAEILDISSRTVEHHINSIKLKTGLHYKSELIEIFYDNFNSML
jgi:DNA-binding CsgD family transcriptional regulator